METTLSTKGQIVIPAEFRKLDGIEPGATFDIERDGRGEYRLVYRPSVNDGLVDWLLSCPDKGYFTPIESESTDDL